MGVDAYDIAKISRTRGIGNIDPLQSQGFTPIPSTAPTLVAPSKVDVKPVEVPKGFDFNDFLSQAEKWTSAGLQVAQIFKKSDPASAVPPPPKQDNTMIYVAGGGMALLLMMAMMMGGSKNQKQDL